jgi:hypothetical protein
MNKPLVTVVMAAAALASTFASTIASAQPMQGPGGRPGYMEGRDRAGCFRGESRGACRDRLSVERRSQHHYVWRNGRYEDQDNAGAAVAGGILGFILGAAIAGSSSDRDYYNAHRNDRGWRTRCRQSYSNFDHRNGTYLGSDGYRHYCTR